jgi:hypothetical protein
MSDTNQSTDGPASTESTPGAQRADDAGAPSGASGGEITGWDDTLLKAALAVLALLALVATIRFYLSLSSAIGTWVTHEYRDLAQAAFNLVVLLVTGVGISAVVRRLAARS